MKAIVVGAGGTTRDLLRGLGEIWDVAVVDINADRLNGASEIRQIETIEGDGSSRLVLERAGLATADALVAATGDDSVNLEACRLAEEASLSRIVAVAADPERLDEYRDLGISVVSPDRLTARRIEINLEPRRVSSAAFADGRAEAIEFLITEDSLVRGRRLRDLHSESWLIAAILRGGEVIIPHGNTTLLAGDRVTVVGQSASYASLVRTFTAGEARFPTDYGKQVAVAVDSPADLAGAFEEAVHLTRNSSAEVLTVIHRDDVGDEQESGRIEALRSAAVEGAEGVDLRWRAVAGSPHRHVLGLSTSDSVGLAVLRPGSFGGRVRAVRQLRQLQRAGVPTLVAGSGVPYRRILVPARATPAGRDAGRAAVDLAFYLQAQLVGVAVIPPLFIAGPEARDEALEAVAMLREQAAVQGVAVRRRIRQGNPVRNLEEAALPGDLLVLGLPSIKPTVFTPGIAGHLVRRVATSVLIIPSVA